MSVNTTPNQVGAQCPGNMRATDSRPKKNGCLIAALIGGGVLIVFIIVFFALFVYLLSAPSADDVSTYSGRDGFVAVLHVEGTITNTRSTGLFATPEEYDHEYLMNAVHSLIGNPNNKGILLYIDSPGGEVYTTDELYLKLLEYKEITGRPIYAYCASMAASGGYYLAVTGDKILMNRNCMTGSIGVTAGTVIDISGFLQENGIKTTSIYVGRNKNMGSYFDEFSDEQKEIYTGILQESYDQFVEVVADGRNMSVEEVTVLADGRIYSPKQALENGLIDGIMGYQETVDLFIRDQEWPESVSFVPFRPVTQIGFGSLFAMLEGNRQTDLENYLSHAGNPIEGMAYYYEGFGR